MAIGARINQTKYTVFRWRYELSVTKKLALSLGVAAFVGLLAQIRTPNPLMPEIPITGQTFGVLLAAVFLGRWWGGASMAMYATLGFAGVPWFSGWAHGVSPTSGYIIGFVLAALFLGHFTDKYIRSRCFFVMLGLMLVADFIIVWIPGLIWRGVWLDIVANRSTTVVASLVGSAPFVPGDVIKAAAAAAVARALTPKMAYNGEVDRDKWKTWRIP